MKITGIDDIENERRKKANKEVSDDITDVFEKVMFSIGDHFKRKEIERDNKNRRNPRKRIKKFFGYLGLFGLFILVINFVLGNIWLLKSLIKSLFGLE